MKRGFSLVELTIVITVMAILLTLGVVNLSASQANGRDVERKTDVATIAQHLETYLTSNSNPNSIVMGSYPSTDLVGNETTYLPDIDPKNLMAPGQSSSSLVVATNQTQTTSGVLPQPTIDQYVYQPLKSDSNLCASTNDECTRFNIYYRLEVENAECPDVNKICMITSKNQ